MALSVILSHYHSLTNCFLSQNNLQSPDVLGQNGTQAEMSPESYSNNRCTNDHKLWSVILLRGLLKRNRFITAIGIQETRYHDIINCPSWTF